MKQSCTMKKKDGKGVQGFFIFGVFAYLKGSCDLKPSGKMHPLLYQPFSTQHDMVRSGIIHGAACKAKCILVTSQTCYRINKQYMAIDNCDNCLYDR